MSVKCPKCHHENPDDTIYCGKCATQLPPIKDIEVTENGKYRDQSIIDW